MDLLEKMGFCGRARGRSARVKEERWSGRPGRTLRHASRFAQGSVESAKQSSRVSHGRLRSGEERRRDEAGADEGQCTAVERLVRHAVWLELVSRGVRGQWGRD